MSEKHQKQKRQNPNAAPPSFEPIGQDAGNAFHVHIDGFEGPLDLLLFLARQQKVDLSRISVLELSEQYLAFMKTCLSRQLDIAAEYLLVAAWLAYMKSCLLLPAHEDNSAADEGWQSAEWLLWKLEKLQAMRDAAVKLMARPRLGRDVFARGSPERIERVTKIAPKAQLYDLLSAYARLSSRMNAPEPLQMGRDSVISMDEARRWLETLFEMAPSWQRLERFLPQEAETPLWRSAVASSLTAALQMALEGRVELRQDTAFAPLYLRRLDEGGEKRKASSAKQTVGRAA